MPKRLINLIVKNEAERKKTKEERDHSSLNARVEQLLRSLDPREHPELLKPVKGVSALTQWEVQVSNGLSLILEDEISSFVVLDLPDMARRSRTELRAMDEIGPAAVRALPPILVDDVEKTLRRFEKQEARRGS